MHVYPTAPAGMQQPAEDGVTPSAPRPLAEGEESMQSPGKTKSPMSMMKEKARKFKDRIKKVTGSNNTTTHDHGKLNNEHKVTGQGDHAFPHPSEYGHDDVDGRTDSIGHDEEEDDHIRSGNHDQSKFEQARFIGIMDRPGNGSEVEVHGGVPASALGATPGMHHDDSPEQPKTSHLEDAPYTSHNNALNHAPHTSYNDVPSTDTAYQLEPKPRPSDNVPYTSYDNAPTKLDPLDDLPPSSHIEGSEDISLEASSVGMPPSADDKRSTGSLNPPSSDMLSQTEPASSESPRSDVNVTYPDDIVKPNPEYGHSSSPVHNKIAVINEEFPAEAKLDAGHAPEDYGSQQSLLNVSVPENAPLTFEEGESGDKPASNAVVGSPLTLPADEEKTSTGTRQRFDNSDLGLNDSEQEGGRQSRGAGSFGTDEYEMPLVTAVGDETSDHKKDDDYIDHKKDDEYIKGVSNDDGNEQPLISKRQSDSDSREKLPVSYMISNDDSPFAHNVQPSVDTTPSGKHDSETPRVTAVGDERCIRREDNDMESNVVNDSAPTVGPTVRVGADEGKCLHDHGDINTCSDVPAPTNAKEDEEYYEPNNANDNQFQEGFSLGAGEAEEKDLNGTSAGSTIEKSEGSTDVVAGNKLDLTSSSHPDASKAASVENADVGDRIDDDSSPQVGSEKQGRTGVVQGLKNTVASTVGYGEVTSPKPSNEHGTEPQPEISVEDEPPANSPQQTGGALQGLRNLLASKLGYGVHEKSPNEQTAFDESGEHANALKLAGHTSSGEVDSIPDQQETGGDASKLGYGGPMQKPAADNRMDGTRDISRDEGPPVSPVVENEVAGVNPPSSVTQKLFDTAAAPKDYPPSKAGN